MIIQLKDYKKIEIDISKTEGINDLLTLENIDLQIMGLDVAVSVLIINDASTESKPEINFNLNNLKSVQVINMKENRGHARCNAAGLKYISEKENVDYVLKNSDGYIIGELSDHTETKVELI